MKKLHKDLVKNLRLAGIFTHLSYIPHNSGQLNRNESHIYWLFFQHFIAPMLSFCIMIAYSPWRCCFLRLTLQVRKMWTAKVGHYYPHLGVKLVSCSFADWYVGLINITIIIQHENVWKTRLMCHLKHILDLQKNRFINKPNPTDQNCG